MQSQSPRPSIKPTELVRRVTVAAVLFGIGLVFFLNGRSPGWQPFAMVSFVSLISLIFLMLTGRGSSLISFFAFVVLLLAMFWKPGQPWAALTGVILVLLNAFKDARAEETDAMSDAISAQPDVPAASSEEQEYIGL
jgi:hypothetical protein